MSKYVEDYHYLSLNPLFSDLCDLQCKLAVFDIDHELQLSLDNFLRKFYISRMFYNQSVIAIAGLQGVGKTFFLRNYLNLDEKWLQDNPGRGECFPILVQEKEGIETPEGVICTLHETEKKKIEIVEDPVSPEKFTNIVQSGLQKGKLLPILYVPPVSGLENFGALLLPGYETKKSDWQELMIHALLSSGLPVIVADQESLATDGYQAIRDDLRKMLDNVDPVVVVSHVDEETKCPDNFPAVQRALALQSKDQLVYIGRGSKEYVAKWREEVNKVLIKNSNLQLSWKKKQLLQLRAMLSEELPTLLNDLKSRVREQIDFSHDGGLAIQILETFDKSVTDLRKKFDKISGTISNDWIKKAKDVAKERYNKEEGGPPVRVIIKKIGDLFSNDDRKENNLNQILKNTWEETKLEVAKSYLDNLTKLTQNELNISGVNAMDHNDEKTTALDKYGYPPQKKQYSEMKISPAVMENIRLFFSTPKEDRSQTLDDSFQSTIKLLPTLALEFSRLSTLFDYEQTMISKPDTKSNFADDFKATSDSGKKIIQTLGYMFAIDACADGKIDTIPALWKLISGTTGNPYVTAAVAVFAIATAMLTATKEINAEHRLCRNALAAAIDENGKRLREQMMHNFEEMMEELRRVIQSRLEIRYHLEKVLGEQESAAKKIMDVEEKRKELLHVVNKDNILA